MSDTTQRPLIDVARDLASAGLRDSIVKDAAWAACYVIGYDDGRESVAAEKNAGFVLANQRIAELEAFIAEQDAHNKGLRDEVTKMHKLYGNLAASRAALGVVVDHAMVERAYDAWRSTIVGGDCFRNAVTAALTSATTVPLASAEPECWKLGTGDDTEFWRSDCGEGIPCYLGIEEVRDGE